MEQDATTGRGIGAGHFKIDGEIGRGAEYSENNCGFGGRAPDQEGWSILPLDLFGPIVGYVDCDFLALKYLINFVLFQENPRESPQSVVMFTHRTEQPIEILLFRQ